MPGTVGRTDREKVAAVGFLISYAEVMHYEAETQSIPEELDGYTLTHLLS